jgi:hypothetical protein
MPPAWPETIDYGREGTPSEMARKWASRKAKSPRVFGHTTGRAEGGVSCGSIRPRLHPRPLTIPLPARAMREYAARGGGGSLYKRKRFQNVILKRLRMKLRSLCAKFAFVAALALTAHQACAQDGLEGAWSRASLSPPTNLGTPFSQTLAAADFDGDNKPDGAVLVDDGWIRAQYGSRRIELHFTGRGNADLTFESNEIALAIVALDVNKDGATDIVVEQPLTCKRLQVWLNDGRGEFRKVRSEDFPSAEVGNHERHASPSQWPDGSALCLPPQGGYGIVILAACPSPYCSSSARQQALAFGSPIGSRAVAPNAPRAPPLSESL